MAGSRASSRKAQYGGGTVLLWDRGTWAPERPDPEQAYRKGSLKFRLRRRETARQLGAGADGRQGRQRAARELAADQGARRRGACRGSDTALVDENPLSVATGRSMDDDRRRPRPGLGFAARRNRPATRRRRNRATPAHRGRSAGWHRAAPASAQCPICSRRSSPPSSRQPPDGDDWLHEIKYDGYRLLARIENGDVRLITRNGLDWTGKFPALARALAELPVDTALIDGEVVALAADGTTSFAALQEHLRAATPAALCSMPSTCCIATATT